MQKMKNRRSAMVGAVLFVVLVLAVLGGTHVQAIKNQLNDWKLLPRPERLTELYFTHPNNLPAKYTPGQTQKVSFTVHNLEYQKTTYHYAIVEASQNGSDQQQLDSGSFTLSQNQYARPMLDIALKDDGSAATISVLLRGQNESITYHVVRETL